MSVPDSVSMQDLSNLYDTKLEEIARSFIQSNNGDLMSSTEIEDLAECLVENAESLAAPADKPLLLKVIALKIVARLMRWHVSTGNAMIEREGHDGDHVSWFKDAGVLQAAGSLIQQVNVSDCDYTVQGS